MEYYSAFKGNKVLIPAISWMNLEPLLLNEMSDTKGHLHEVSSEVKFLGTESRMAFARGWWEGGMGNCLMETDFQFGKMKKFGKRMVVTVSQQCGCPPCH